MKAITIRDTTMKRKTEVLVSSVNLSADEWFYLLFNAGYRPSWSSITKRIIDVAICL